MFFLRGGDTAKKIGNFYKLHIARNFLDINLVNYQNITTKKVRDILLYYLALLFLFIKEEKSEKITKSKSN